MSNTAPIDQFFISLGLDPEGVKKGLSNAEQFTLNGMAAIVADLQNGAKKADNALEDGFENAAQNIKKDMRSMQNTVDRSMQNIAQNIKKDMRSAENAVDNSMEDVSKNIKKELDKSEGYVKRGMMSIKEAFGVGLAALGVGGLFNDYIEGSKEVGKYSKLLGMSAEDLQAWQGAAVAMGAEGSEAIEMLVDMTEYLHDATLFGAGPAVEIFEKYGISATDAAGNVKDATQVLLELAAAGEKMTSDEMLSLGKIMSFDKDIIALLQQGENGLKDLLETNKKLAVYKDEDIALSKQVSTANRTGVASLKALVAEIMRGVLPHYEAFISKSVELVTWVKENENVLTALAIAIGVVLIPKIVALGIAGAAAMLPFTPFIALIGGLTYVIQDLITYIDTGTSSLESFWSMFGSGEAIGQWFDDMIAKFKDLIGSVGSFLRFWDDDDDDDDTKKEKSKKHTPKPNNDKPKPNDDKPKPNDDKPKLNNDTTQNSNLINNTYNTTKNNNTRIANTVQNLKQIHQNNVNPQPLVPATQNINNNSQTTTNISKIEVHTQATDANGIAKGIGKATKKEMNYLPHTANSGVNTK